MAFMYYFLRRLPILKILHVACMIFYAFMRRNVYIVPRTIQFLSFGLAWPELIADSSCCAHYVEFTPKSLERGPKGAKICISILFELSVTGE